MNYRWMPPAAGAFAFIVLMSMAKDSEPWPLYIALALAALVCAAWALLVHHRGRSPRSSSRACRPGG